MSQRRDVQQREQPEDDTRIVSFLPPARSRDLSLAGAIAGWLHEYQHSERTFTEYGRTLVDFRQEVQHAGLDLDADDEASLGLLAQAWAARPHSSGRPVANATHNRRLAIVSSFYTYARRFGLKRQGSDERVSNPIDLVKRRRVRSYASARPLDHGDVVARLEAIDRRFIVGKRDFALLLVALNTGRRLNELASMRWGDVQLVSSGKVARVNWPHTKGDKVMFDELDPGVTSALIEWLYAAYGAEIGSLTPTAAIWLPLAYHRLPPREQYRPMAHDAIRDLYMKRLGTSKVHTSRHTFAAAMVKVGASVLEIQERLGHERLDTTQGYLKHVTGGVNRHAEKLAAYFGVAGEKKGKRR